MQFTFSIPTKTTVLHFQVSRVYQGQSIEKFVVTLGGAGTILLQSNRPYLLHHKLDVPVKWKQLKGSLTRPYFDDLCIRITEYLKKDLPVIQSPALTLF